MAMAREHIFSTKSVLQCNNSLMKFYSNRTQETINQSIFQIQWWKQQGVNKKSYNKAEKRLLQAWGAV